ILVPYDSGGDPGGDPAIAACEAEAATYSLDPTVYEIIAGTDEADSWDLFYSDTPRIICGFDGDDVASFGGDDIFIGGPGSDYAQEVNGTFFGGDGDDVVQTIRNGGYFIGGPGN